MIGAGVAGNGVVEHAGPTAVLSLPVVAEARAGRGRRPAARAGRGRQLAARAGRGKRPAAARGA